MKLNLLLFLAIFAALATISPAQTNNFQNQTALNVTAGDNSTADFSRPRRVEGKVAEFKASVVVNIASVENIAFDMINQQRAENGLRPLTWSDVLAKVARQHSQNMAEFKFFSHRGVDNKMVSDRADNAGLVKWRAIGENIAFNRGYQDPVGKAVELWLDSPSHRHNLMDENWKESAVGVAVAPDGSYYFTQVFLLRK